MTTEDNLKICDFGWSVNQNDDMRLTFCGTYEYMAPEIIENVGYDKKVDIWSLGILLYELLHGYSPFRGDNPNIVFKNIKSGLIRYSNDISGEAKELISGILKKEPKQRLSIEQILAHPLLIKYEPLKPQLEEKLSVDLRLNHLNTEATDLPIKRTEETTSPTAAMIKENSNNLPPRPQSRIYSMIEKKAAQSPLVQTNKAYESFKEEQSSQSHFEDLINMHKKEILGTNNPMKSYLSQHSTSHHSHNNNINKHEEPYNQNPSKASVSYLGPNPYPKNISPNRINLSHLGEKNFKISNQPSYQSSIPLISSSTNPLAAILNSRLNTDQTMSSKHIHSISNIHPSKHRLHNRNASYTISSRTIHHNPISTQSRSKLDMSYQRSKSNRLDSEENEVEFRERYRNGDVKMDKHLKSRFEEIVRSHNPHVKSEVQVTQRRRDDSREYAGDNSAVYKPLLSRRGENNSRDGSVGKMIDLSSSKIGHERADSSVILRKRENSTDKRSYLSNILPEILNHTSAVHRPNANSNGEERENSLSRIKRAEKSNSFVSNSRYEQSPGLMNKENSKYYSNLDSILRGYTSRNNLSNNDSHVAALNSKVYSPYLGGQLYSTKPPPGKNDHQNAASSNNGYMSSHLFRHNSIHQYSNL